MSCAPTSPATRAIARSCCANCRRPGSTIWRRPDGAFYIYADVARITDDSPEFCRRMLAEAGVAATPGTDFDPEEGRHYVRFSFAGSTEDIETAVWRLRDWRR